MDKYSSNRSSCNRCSTQANRRDASVNSNCMALKARLQQVDFAITETVLYLDAYPECVEALEYYHRLVNEREQLINVIDAQCGPMTHFGNVSTESWQWINSPWPWKYEAN